MADLDQDDFFLSMLAADDVHAMGILFDKYYDLLHTVVCQYVSDAEDADDIVQELFINLWKKRQTLNFTKPLSRYLIKAALNRTRNFLRDKKRSREVMTNPYTIKKYENRLLDSSSHSSLERDEINKLVAQAKQRMTPRVRFTYILSRNQSMTYAEIAAYMGISIKGVEKNMSIALRILRETFGPYLKILILFSVMELSLNIKTAAHQDRLLPYSHVIHNVFLQYFQSNGNREYFKKKGRVVINHGVN